MGMKSWGIKFSQHNQTDNITCQNHWSKHLNFNDIYRVSYKIAKKAGPNDPRISISHTLNPFIGRKIHSSKA